MVLASVFRPPLINSVFFRKQLNGSRRNFMGTHISPPYLQIWIFFKVFYFRIFNDLGSFSLTLDPVGGKISKHHSSQSFHRISTTFYDNHGSFQHYAIQNNAFLQYYSVSKKLHDKRAVLSFVNAPTTVISSEQSWISFNVT